MRCVASVGRGRLGGRGYGLRGRGGGAIGLKGAWGGGGLDGRKVGEVLERTDKI